MKFAIKITFAAICLITIIFSGTDFSKADSIESVNQDVTVVPAKFELRGSPGSTVSQVLKITNEDNESSLMALSVESFGVINEDGDVVLDQNNSPYADQLFKWITFENQGLQFGPKETKLVSFQITIPKDAEPGGRYASIVVSRDKLNRPQGEPGGTAKVVSLLMFTVSGDIRDNASVASFDAQKLDNGENINFVLRVKNSGNNHEKPTGQIVITNIWGTKIDSIDLDADNVLPNLTRKMTTLWQPDKILFGRYTATLISTYGDRNNSLTSATSFWFLPWWLVMIMIIALLAIGFVLIKAIKFSLAYRTEFLKRHGK